MRTIYAHELVAKTAKEMAESLYEEVMSGSNELYANWKNQWPEKTEKERHKLFVQLVYPKLLEPARAILAHMLGERRYEHLHEGIYDSILKDATLRVGRVAPRQRQRIVIEDSGK